MIMFVVNLLLAIAWVAISGSATVHNLAFGFVIAAIALTIVGEPYGSTGYLKRSRAALSLLLLFARELALSVWRVAIAALRPRLALQPGIFAFRLTVDRDFEITLLANLITLTPGTLSVDVSSDRKLLYVHALDCSDPEGLQRDIAQGFERKIMEAFR